MQILDGKKVAETVAEELRERIATLRTQNVEPTLAILVVGDDLRTQRYIAAKQRAAERLDIRVILIPIAPATPTETTAVIQQAITALNNKPEVHGIILQLPIPVAVDEQELIDLIAPTKDVDGLTLTNQAALELGRELFLPATPQGILRLLSAYKIPIANQRIAVVGQGKLVGKPVTAMLQSRDADVVTANSRTKDLKETIRGAAVVISAVGKKDLITEDMVDKTMALIDVGLSDVDGKLYGDITSTAKDKALLATPVPGGIGPMTVISLLANVVLAAELTALRANTDD